MRKETISDGELAAELLQRNSPPIYGEDAQRLITGKKIIVTGAGGSIGSEIVRQLKRIDPNCKVYFIDHSEYALYLLQLSLEGRPLLTQPEYILADITNRTRMHEIFARIQPDMCFHAAAHKQLPLLEKSPEEAIKNNVLGTEIIAESCLLNDVGYMVNISTDKAAKPTSILGMTKRLAEMIVASYANSTTKISSVRFGNVLGSRGSFIETLRYQTRHELPITITDPRMTRFFMTIPESAGLVIEAATLANESGSTYILDMGRPIKIVDLVQRYVKFMDYDEPEIIFTGARKGEKFDEELLDAYESYKTTAHPRIRSVDVSSLAPRDEVNLLYHNVLHDTSSEELQTALRRLVTVNQTVMMGDLTKLQETIRLI